MKTHLTLAFLFLTSLFALSQNDTSKEWALQGSTSVQQYISEIPFRYVEGYIFVDIVQNGKTLNFLFDTGADATFIDASVIDLFDYDTYSTTSISGPIVTNQETEKIVLSSIQVADIAFLNTGAVAIELKFARSKFSEPLHGILGNNLFKKAVWQIDYKNKTIKFSNSISNLDLGASFYTIPTKLPEKGWGTETIDLTIDGYTSAFNFDTGNGRSKIVSNSKELRNLAQQNKTSLFHYGLHKEASDYKFIADYISLGDLKISDQIISLENEVGHMQLLGNRFYENFLLTIDWGKHLLYLSPQQEIPTDQFIGFELEFKKNYEQNRLEVATGLKSFTKKHRIRKGAVVIKVDGMDISQFSKDEFRNFEKNVWPDLLQKSSIQITLQQGKKSSELTLTKKELSK